MTTVSAKIITDSVSPDGIRLTTMLLRYPRWIHAEFMTHRVFSRNASSSRAIPVSRLIQDVLDDPAVPMFWGKNQKGMQAGGEHNEPVIARYLDDDTGSQHTREDAWLSAMRRAVYVAEAFDAAGYHKQLVNRLLEPFSHITVVVTATDWANFFSLRRHDDAEPHIHLLADRMHAAMEGSTPNLLQPGQWHLPFTSDADVNKLPGPPDGFTRGVREDGAWFRDCMIKLSVARCARTSYRLHDGGEPKVEDDLKLYERLVGSTPLHASPAEHQATPDNFWLVGSDGGERAYPGEHGNFRGWRQFRKRLPNECVADPA